MSILIEKARLWWESEWVLYGDSISSRRLRTKKLQFWYIGIWRGNKIWIYFLFKVIWNSGVFYIPWFMNNCNLEHTQKYIYNFLFTCNYFLSGERNSPPNIHIHIIQCYLLKKIKYFFILLILHQESNSSSFIA